MNRRVIVVLLMAIGSAVAAQAQPRPMAKPDLTITIAPNGAIGVHNIGDADVNASFEVQVTCSVVGGTRGQKCGDPFVDGHYAKSLTLPAGFNQPWSLLSPGMQTLIQYGKGWAIIYPAMGAWPKGSYHMYAIVDSANAIDEKLEANNATAAVVQRP